MTLRSIAVGTALSLMATAAFAGPGVTEAQRALCDRLLGAVGESAWVEEEGQLEDFEEEFHPQSGLELLQPDFLLRLVAQLLLPKVVVNLLV